MCIVGVNSLRAFRFNSKAFILFIFRCRNFCVDEYELEPRIWRVCFSIIEIDAEQAAHFI